MASTNTARFTDSNLLAVIAEAAPVGIVAVSGDGEIVSANEQAARILGCDSADALRSLPLETFHKHPAVALEVILERLEDGPVSGMEMDLLRQDGREVRVRLSATVRTMGDRPVVVGSLEDVTRPSLEEEDSTHSQKMETVERFAAGLAHEYNNVLTAVIGETRQLLGELPEEGEATRAAANIHRAARRASGLTRRLQVFSKSEVVRREVTELSGAVRATEAAIRAAVPSDINLVWRIDAGRRRVKIPHQDVEQILQQLVANARDAMPAGGRVVVETGGVEAPHDTEGMEYHPPVPPGDYALLAVGDNGVGMNQETRTRVFDPFFTTKPFGAGAGLGLTTVYSLVRRAGGHISVMSAPAYGTLVRILLPLARDEEMGVPATPVAGVWDQPAEGTILVVDDDPAVRRVVVRLLSRAGFTVLDAPDGMAALALVEELAEPIDMLVTDVMMPRVKGTELAVRVVRKWPSVRVLLISGYTDSPLIQQWVDVDPDVFLAKPFEPEELLNRVKTRLAASED